MGEVMRFLGLGLAAAVCAMLSSAAAAAPLKWTLQDWRFNDGGVASGSFAFDADTSTYQDIFITTSGGTKPSRVFDTFFFGAGNSLVVTEMALADYTGAPILSAFFQSTLSSGGGTISVLGVESVCGDSGCVSGDNTGDRFLVSGSVTTNPVPIPAGVLLLATGIGVLALRRRG